MENWFFFSPHDDHSIAVLQLITMFYEGFIFLLVVVNKSECQWIRSNIRRASAKKHSNKATASKCLISEYVLRLYTGVFGYVDTIAFAGHVKVLYAGLVGNVLRFMYISWLTNPWWVLPFEFVQGKMRTLNAVKVNNFMR